MRAGAKSHYMNTKQRRPRPVISEETDQHPQNQRKLRNVMEAAEEIAMACSESKACLTTKGAIKCGCIYNNKFLTFSSIDSCGSLGSNAYLHTAFPSPLTGAYLHSIADTASDLFAVMLLARITTSQRSHKKSC